MNSTLRNRLIILGFPLIALGACSKASAPLVTLSIQGTQKNAASAASVIASSALSKTVDIKDAAGAVVGSLVISTARVVLKEIEFKEESEHNQDDQSGGDGEETSGEFETSFDFKGPYVVDLVSDTISPPIGLASLPVGNYTEIELKLDKVEGDEDDESGDQLVPTSDPLYGNSIYIEGLYTGPSSTGAQIDTPFKMSFDLDEEFELSGPANTSNGLNVSAEAQVDVIIAFRLQKWFTFSNEDTNAGGTLSPNQIILQSGEIVLDDQATGANDSIRDMIKENIKDSADYGEDKNDDGLLGSDEDDDPDTEDEDDD